MSMLRIEMAQRLSGACALWLVVMAVGCSDGKLPAPKPREMVCAANTSYSCVGKNTCPGRQVCNALGTVLSACECIDQAVAGSGGAGGDSGDDAGTLADAGVHDDSGIRDDAGTTQSTCGNGNTCVPAAPNGFEGPVALYVGKKAPPKCAAAFSAKAFEAGSDPSAASASCSTCECTPATSCSASLDFRLGAALGCGGSTCTEPVSASCVEIAPSCIAGLTTAALKTEIPSTAAQCEPSAQVASKGKAAFGTQVLGCALEDPQRRDCKSAELCVPEDKGAAFQGALCVWKAGNVACPSGQYEDKRVYDREILDTRKCSACDCNSPQCSYTWKVFAAGDTSCATPVVSLSGDNQCVQVNPSGDKLRVGASASGTGACTPSGGAAEGGVSSSNPITVCCAKK